MLDRAPKLFPDVIWIWNAFRLMSRSRGNDFGSPRPLDVITCVSNYCSLMQIKTEEERDDLIALITVLDDEWLTYQSGEREKRKEADERKAKSSAKSPSFRPRRR